MEDYHMAEPRAGDRGVEQLITTAVHLPVKPSSNMHDNVDVRTLACDFCEAKFKRQEHLQRHRRRHLGSKPFTCGICEKSFSRQDTLRRHIDMHHAFPNSFKPSPVFSSRRQACRECSKTKQRCHGGIPCVRCTTKAVTCRHPGPATWHRAAEAKVPNQSVGLSSQTQSSTVASAPDAVVELNGDLGAAQTDAETVTPSVPSSNDQVGPILLVQDSPKPFDPENYQDYGFFLNADGGETLDVITSFDFSAASYPPLSWTMAGSDAISAIMPSNCRGITTDPQFARFIQAPDFLRDECGGGSQQVAPLEPPHAYAEPNHTSVSTATNGLGPSILEFSHFSQEDEYTILTEDHCHPVMVQNSAHRSVQEFWHAQGFSPHRMFPSREAFQAFVQLFFEYFDPYFPFIHPTIVGQSADSWILLLAVTTIGCQYSEISNAEQCATSLLELLDRAITIQTPQVSSRPCLSYVQSILLRDIAAWFSGDKTRILRMQYQRNHLPTAYRALLANQPADHLENTSTEVEIDSAWRRWLHGESLSRLRHCILRFEMMQLLLSNLQPILQLNDLNGRLRPPSALWHYYTAHEWEAASYSKAQSVEPVEYFAIHQRLLGLCLQEWQLNLSLTISFDFIDRGNSKDGSTSQLQEIHKRPELAAVLREMTKTIEGLADDLASSNCGNTSSQDRPPFLDLTSHIVFILRGVNIKALFGYTGWQTDQIGVQHAKQTIAKWMKKEERLARECLWHAARIFRVLRQTKRFTCYEPLILLYAVTYICAFNDYAGLSCVSDGEQGTGQQCRKRVIRLDFLDRATLADTWYDTDEDVGVHISGIGVLEGPKSTHRIWSTLKKTLMGSISWSRLCQGLVYNTDQLLRGEQPCFREDTISEL